MKSYTFFALASAVAAAPAAIPSTTSDNAACPSANGQQIESNNFNPYTITCNKWVNATPIRTTDTEIGLAGCLTACDGTVGCASVVYIATDDAKTRGSCSVYASATLLDTSEATNSWAAAVPLRQPSTPSPTTTATPSPPAPTKFAGIAIRSASDIQYAAVNASGLALWLNKDTSTYCPAASLPAGACPPGNSTIFAGGNGTLGMATVVPGGQQVYVAADGRVRYTQAHSGNTGTGSKVVGFSVTSQALMFEGSDFLACPEAGEAEGVYGVYAASVRTGGAGCLGFRFRVEAAVGQGAGAWQYA